MGNKTGDRVSREIIYIAIMCNVEFSNNVYWKSIKCTNNRVNENNHLPIRQINRTNYDSKLLVYKPLLMRYMYSLPQLRCISQYVPAVIFRKINEFVKYNNRKIKVISMWKWPYIYHNSLPSRRAHASFYHHPIFINSANNSIFVCHFSTLLIILVRVSLHKITLYECTWGTESNWQYH